MARSSSDVEPWPDYLAAAAAGLRDLTITAGGTTLSTAEGFARWVRITREGQMRGQHLYLAGNGASAMMASHFAADACKNGGLSAMAFNDAALLTATRSIRPALMNCFMNIAPR